ncbi:hypothetical protein RI129_007266 [Pyrocoelia pectoralis]|uniref:DDE Tnp4 domain-containing protein n=1 Tax=Pyrocoelia pectoralis TaxID=417401 RepID=A0AAN7VDB1_9COLE
MDIFENDIIEDDLDALEVIEVGIPRTIYQRSNHFDQLSEWDFFRRFRLQKETVLNVLAQIEHELEFPYDRNNSVSPINQLLIALRFYATGTHLLCISDFAGAHSSTFSRIVHRVSRAIASLTQRYIKLPSTRAEILDSQRIFYEIAQFPQVIGAVDGTHIRIQSPGGKDSETFRNRKSYFSLNVQGISDASMKFIDIVVRWPGSSHDATIFNSSRVRAKLEQQNIYSGVLLGDSAYPLRRYLLTPLLQTNNAAEQLYNENHIRTRGRVEKLFGIWKRRSPVLAYGGRLKLNNTLTVIVATAVLHNIARNMGEELPPCGDNEEQLNNNVNQGNLNINYNCRMTEEIHYG